MPWYIALPAGLVLGVVIDQVIHYFRRKNDEKEIANAEEEANRIITNAIKTGEAKKREAEKAALKAEILKELKESGVIPSEDKKPVTEPKKTDNKPKGKK